MKMNGVLYLVGPEVPPRSGNVKHGLLRLQFCRGGARRSDSVKPNYPGSYCHGGDGLDHCRVMASGLHCFPWRQVFECDHPPHLLHRRK